MKFHALVISFFLLHCTLFAQADDHDLLLKNIEALIHKHLLGSAWLGIALQDLETKTPLLEFQSNKLFVPASNLKLFTTAAALESLGPDFRFKTSLFTNGTVHDSTLEGDLIIYGRGDPTLSTKKLKSLAKMLYEKGVRFINGNIIGNDSFLSPVKYSPTHEIEDLGAYAPEISALSIKDNTISVEITPSPEIGEPARITIKETIPYCSIINTTQTTQKAATELSLQRTFEGDGLIAKGSINRENPPLQCSMALAHDASYIAPLFKHLLAQASIETSGRAYASRALEGEVQELAAIFSKPLYTLITTINKESDNQGAELLFEAVKMHHGLSMDKKNNPLTALIYPSSLASPSRGIVVSDGCGLSRHNLLSPRHIIFLLSYVMSQPYGPFFYSSLPIGGVDGTLQERLKDTFQKNNIRAKTGTLSGIAALGGYAITGQKRQVAFSIMVNNHLLPKKACTAFIDELLVMLLEHF